jgi:hypothetical protein
MGLTACLWVIWNDWAGFFLWLTAWDTISNRAGLYDFSNFYGEGKWLLSRAYLQQGSHVFSYPFAYPPSSLPFFGFFAQFDFGTAAQLWTTLDMALFIAAMLSAAVILKPARRYLFVSVAALLFFTSYALRAELQIGQINLILASLTIMSLTAHRSKHSRTSATLLALGALLKGPPALFLVYFVFFHRDLRYLFHFLESTIAILGISLLVVPIQVYCIWIANIFPTLFVSALLPSNESVTGAISLSGLSYLTPSVFVAGFCTFAVFAYCVYPSSLTRRGCPSLLGADAMFLMNSLVILLLGTRSWPQDYVWVILPTALFLSALLMENVKTSYFMVVGLAAFLFNFEPYPIFLYYLSQYYSVTTSIQPHTQTLLPTGLIGSLLMTPALTLLFVRPKTILQHPINGHLLPSRLTRK